MKNNKKQLQTPTLCTLHMMVTSVPDVTFKIVTQAFVKSLIISF